MMANRDRGQDAGRSTVTPFPQSRVGPPRSKATPKNLGTSLLSRQLGLPTGQATGHWCSRCHGIWYGYVLEVTCPSCGGRHG
jgi:hypothetical protein